MSLTQRENPALKKECQQIHNNLRHDLLDLNPSPNPLTCVVQNVRIGNKKLDKMSHDICINKGLLAVTEMPAPDLK